jgi:hypothetical protein
VEFCKIKGAETLWKLSLKKNRTKIKTKSRL